GAAHLRGGGAAQAPHRAARAHRARGGSGARPRGAAPGALGAAPRRDLAARVAARRGVARGLRGGRVRRDARRPDGCRRRTHDVNRRGWRCFTAVAAAAAFCACGRDEAAPAKGTPVTAERVSAHRIVEQIQATGELVAVEEASVAAEVGGRITALRVSEGAPVHAGDVVLEIDRERRELELANENAMVAAARSEIAQQRRELDRIRTLHKSEAASQAQLDAATTRVSAAEAALAAAEAKLGLARLALRNASVAAPFDGLVARRVVSAGAHGA